MDRGRPAGRVLVRRWTIAAVVAVVAFSMPSPLLVATWTATSDLQVLSREELAASRWVAEETPPGAVFVTDGWVNSLTDSAGRRRLTTFGPYVANLGYERTAHRRRGDHLLWRRPDALVELMRRYGATYVVDGGRPRPCAAPGTSGRRPRSSWPTRPARSSGAWRSPDRPTVEWPDAGCRRRGRRLRARHEALRRPRCTDRRHRPQLERACRRDLRAGRTVRLRQDDEHEMSTGSSSRRAAESRSAARTSWACRPSSCGAASAT